MSSNGEDSNWRHRLPPHFENIANNFAESRFDYIDYLLPIDRLVLIGNHRDAWIYGGGDPSSGTASMVETARVMGKLKSFGMYLVKQLTFQ